MQRENNLQINLKRKILISVLICVILACGIGLFLLRKSNAVADVVLNQTPLKSEYALGETVEIPAGELTVLGETKSVQPTVYTPSGIATKASSILLNETGKYVLEYGVNKDGNYYSTKNSFVVYDYVASNSATSAPLIYKKTTVTNIGGNPDKSQQIEGLSFAIKPAEKVVYNKIVNISESTSSDVLISLEATPDVFGKVDARDFFIRLTDIYDEDNYVTIRLRREPSLTAEGAYKDDAYIAISHGIQPFTGWLDSNTLSVEPSNYMTPIRNGIGAQWCQKHVPIEIYYDNATKTFSTFYEPNNSRKIVNMLEDFKEPWQGFTTGEIFISMWAEAYETVDLSKPFNGMILGIFGEDFTKGLGEDGTVALNKIESTKAPAIDFGEYVSYNDIPDAMVGHPYAIYGSYDYSIYVKKQPSVKVYYGYNSTSRYSLPIENNCFVPVHDGIHTIEYVIEDVYGNIQTKLVDVYARKDNGKTFQMLISGTEGYTSATVGYAFSVPTAENLAFSDNLGNVKVSVIARHSDGTEMEVKDYSFVPVKGGEWTIIYKGVDAVLRTGECSYKVQATVSGEVIFESMKDLPKYFVVGAKNPLPVQYVIDYNVNSEQRASDKILVKKGDTTVEVTDGIFTPEEVGVYTVIYQATSSKDVTASREYEVRAVDVGFPKTLQLDKYFYSDAIVSSEALNKNISFTTKANSIVEFIRPVNAVNFSFAFNFEKDNLANAFDVSLTDINNPEQVVQLLFIRKGEDVALSVNGGAETILKGYAFGGGAEFAITMSAGQIIIGENAVTFDKFLNGADYLGFDSTVANLTLTAISNLDDNLVKVSVSDVTGQRFNNATKDNIQPKVVNAEPTQTRVLPGERVKVSKVRILDVIDPFVTASLTVEDPKGNPVKDINGVILKDVDVHQDYFIDPTVMGTYKILYKYLDTAGKGSSTGRGTVFRLMSREKPVIDLSTDTVLAKKGDTVTVKNASVQSVSDDVKLYIFVQAPTGNLKELSRLENGDYNKQIELKTSGKYIVRYMAVDEWDNVSISEYLIKVA